MAKQLSGSHSKFDITSFMQLSLCRMCCTFKHTACQYNMHSCMHANTHTTCTLACTQTHNMHTCMHANTQHASINTECTQHVYAQLLNFSGRSDCLHSFV